MFSLNLKICPVLTQTVGDIAHTDRRGAVVVIVAKTVGTGACRFAEVRFGFTVVATVAATLTHVSVDTVLTRPPIEAAVWVLVTFI